MVCESMIPPVRQGDSILDQDEGAAGSVSANIAYHVSSIKASRGAHVP